MRKTMKIVIIMMVISCVLTPAAMFAGGEQEKPATEMSGTEDVSKVKIAFFATGPLDEPWSQSMVQAVEQVKKNPPKGLKLEYKWFEKVPIDEYEKFIRDVIKTGVFDIIWLHDASAGTDPIDNLRMEFPDQILPVSASNYHPVGGNTYWIQTYAHEPAYLCGVIAGLITETNTLGMVAGFPYASVNHALNGFIDGARSVNSGLKIKSTYIESWWDPVKAKETALAQISAGADVIYAERYGAHEAAREKGILAFGHQSDIHELAPETIITSPLTFWEPSIRFIIEEWYDNAVNGTAYDASADKAVSFLMQKGGAAIAPFYDFENTLPEDVLAKYNEILADIMNGSLKVELKLGAVTSD